ncbi:uncharacterized protein LOC132871711 [Neoarius graeffei]|uniref:uncharacterized protein LOC132871711 n=1 Tax=Neoarius graeffei TaxID=443677 RepID=UPI00298BCBEC|nr:uncharacterized protein LOC132871711 [Neoarius graeffei]
MKRLVMGYILPARLIVDPLTEVSLNEEHQLPNTELFVGSEATALIVNEDLSTARIYKTARAFYVETIRKMLKVFPLDSELLKALTVLDPASRLDLSPVTVTRLGEMLPQLRLDPDKLREELIDYQVADKKELPQERKVDRFWGLLGKQQCFSEIARLMKALLCIPHSNASSERTFSMVRKITTENRSSLSNSTLCSFLSCKINYTKPAHKYAPSKNVLKAAKSATYLYLHASTKE